MATNPYEGLSDEALERCVKRMAKTLASKPKRKKTRDYVATIRGRESKPASVIEKELRALAAQERFEYGKQVAQRVLANAPNAPDTFLKRKQRVSPIALHRAAKSERRRTLGLGWSQRRNCRQGSRQVEGRSGSGKRNTALVKELRPVLASAQEHRCGICAKPLPEESTAHSVDHVIPMALGGIDGPGNWVVTHHECNAAKSNDTPTGCEMVFLLMVNAKLGYHPQVF